MCMRLNVNLWHILKEIMGEVIWLQQQQQRRQGWLAVSYTSSNKSKAIFLRLYRTVFNQTNKKIKRLAEPMLEMHAWKIAKLVCWLFAVLFSTFLIWSFALVHSLTYSPVRRARLSSSCTKRKTTMQSKLNKRHKRAHSTKRVEQPYFSFASQVCLYFIYLSHSISISTSLSQSLDFNFQMRFNERTNKRANEWTHKNEHTDTHKHTSNADAI